MRVDVRGHLTPSIDETDDDAAGDEDAVYFEKVHTGLREYAPVLPAHGSTGDRHTALYF